MGAIAIFKIPKFSETLEVYYCASIILLREYDQPSLIQANAATIQHHLAAGIALALGILLSDPITRVLAGNLSPGFSRRNRIARPQASCAGPGAYSSRSASQIVMSSDERFYLTPSHQDALRHKKP